jgi:hypothetical protein
MNVDCTIVRLLASAIKASQYGYKYNRETLYDIVTKYLANKFCPPVDLCITGDVCVPIIAQICTIAATEYKKICPILSIIDLGSDAVPLNCNLSAVGVSPTCPTLTITLL